VQCHTAGYKFASNTVSILWGLDSSTLKTGVKTGSSKILKKLYHAAQNQSQKTVMFSTKLSLKFWMFAEARIYNHLLGYEIV
jgi:hypothetical protein